MIRRTKSGWKVVSEKGKALSAPNLSLKDAKIRLHQVEYFKRKVK